MNSTKFIIGMRDAYFNELYHIFEKDQNAVFLTADNGAPTLDKFAADFPDQYYTVGIAEQQLLGLAAGLAVEGRKVYTYAIMPFVTLRIAEFIKLDQCAMNVDITNIGVGAGYSYDIMGPTHHTMEDIALMRAMPNLTIWSPSDANMAAQLATHSHRQRGPQYIRFDRAGIPDIYGNETIDLGTGMKIAKDQQKADLTIFSTGRFVYQALQVAEILEREYNYYARVVDVFRLKPFDFKTAKYLAGNSPIVTYEEHYLNGGLGSIVLESFNDNTEFMKSILRIGQEDRFVYDMGGREVIWRKYGLDPASAAIKIVQRLRI